MRSLVPSYDTYSKRQTNLTSMSVYPPVRERDQMPELTQINLRSQINRTSLGTNKKDNFVQTKEESNLSISGVHTTLTGSKIEHKEKKALHKLDNISIIANKNIIFADFPQSNLSDYDSKPIVQAYVANRTGTDFQTSKYKASQ